MSRKKILWLCSWYPNKLEPFNGDFIQRHAKAATLYNDIHVIHIAGDSSGAIAGKETTLTQSEGLTEEIIYYKRSISFAGKIMAHYKWLQLFKQAVKKYFAENGEPVVVHIHIPFKAGLLGLWIKRTYKIPYLVTEHWGIYNDVEVNNYEKKPVFFKRLSKKIFLNASKFISVSSYLAEGVNRLVTKKDYIVIPNSVDNALFYFKEKNCGPIFRFIHVSNIVPLKNAEGILESFKLFIQKNINTELVIVGDTGPSIRSLAGELKLLDKVSFRGEVPYEKVAAEMQQSNCFILFSNIENSPCVIGEALCCGIPVIVTNVGGIPELVDAGNSITIEPQNNNALAAAMLKMIECQQDFNHKKIAEDAKSKFSYSIIGKQLDEVYSDLKTNLIL